MSSKQIELEKITHDIQWECHETVNGIFNSKPSKNVNHQDAVNVFFYKKLAEFEYRLRELENTKHSTTNEQ